MLNSLLDRVQHEGNPLIDDDKVTFVWIGENPPLLVGDFTDWNAHPIQLSAQAPGVWSVTLQFPLDAYLEYAFVVKYRENASDTDVDERVVDPFNKKIIFNGINAVNHTFSMRNFQHSPLIRRGVGVKRGKISEHDLAAQGYLDGGYRKLYLYHPPTDEPTPLVIVWDGSDYLNRAYLNIIVDNLIAQKRIRPIALAMIDNAQAGRFAEYFNNEATVEFAIRRLMPFAYEHLSLLDERENPGCHGVLGASMGGLMALYTGIRASSTFGKVISQSGAFFISPEGSGMLIDYLIRLIPTQPISIWQDVGKLEWLLDSNRKMNALLVEHGYNVTYHEFSGGHNYFMWSQTVSQGLEAMYGIKR